MVSMVALLGQLGAVGALAGVSYGLNKLRPPHVRYRPLKLTAWIPALIFGWLLINYFANVNLPGVLFPTPEEVRVQLQGPRALCSAALSTFAEVEKAMYDRPKPSAESVQAHKSPLGQLEPLINQALFSLGVAFVSIPVWIRLLWLGLRRLFKIGSATDSALAPLRTEWGILLPLVNVTTTLTVFTSPFYFFYLLPNRVSHCVYTSGHWYTTGCTVLGFLIVISHILSYLYGDDVLGKRDATSETRQHVKSVLGGLLRFYLVAGGIYLLLVSLVLRVTQQHYHDDFEAQAGLRRSTESFLYAMCLVIVVQYVTFTFTTKSQHRSTSENSLSSSAPSSSTSSSLSSSSTSKPLRPTETTASALVISEPSTSSPSEAAAPTTNTEPTPTVTADDLDDLLRGFDEAPEPPQPQAPQEEAPQPPGEEAPSPPTLALPPPPPPPPAAAPPAKKSSSVPPPPPPPPAAKQGTSGRRDLLDDIATGRTLRKTVREERKKPEETGLAAALSSGLMKIRNVVQPDQADDDEDDSWDEE